MTNEELTIIACITFAIGFIPFVWAVSQFARFHKVKHTVCGKTFKITAAQMVALDDIKGERRDADMWLGDLRVWIKGRQGSIQYDIKPDGSVKKHAEASFNMFTGKVTRYN